MLALLSVRFVRLRLLPVCVVLLGTAQCMAATLAIDPAAVTTGSGSVQLSVLLVSGATESVAALQFDIAYDEMAMTVDEVVAGMQTVNAGKSLSANLLEPGRTRVVIAGLNLNAIADGSVAEISVRAPVGVATLTLSDAILADPQGLAVPVVIQPADAVITIPEMPTGLSDAGAMALLFLLMSLSAASVLHGRSIRHPGM